MNSPSFDWEKTPQLSILQVLVALLIFNLGVIMVIIG